MIRKETKSAAVKAPSKPAPAKSGEVIAPFDYKALPRDQAKIAKDAAAFIESRHRNLSAAVLEIGQKLIDVKASLGHGQFTAWVQAEFTMTMRTAQSYMSAASGVGAKSEIVSHLPVTTLLEVAKSPEPIRAKVLGRMESAHKEAAPLPASTVKNALKVARAEQGQEPTKPRISVAEWAKEKAREKEQEENERRAMSQQQAVAMIRGRFGQDVGSLVNVLRRTWWTDLAAALEKPASPT